MGEDAARGLLRPTTESGSLLMLSLLLAPACLLPPDYREPAADNYAPELLIEAIRPIPPKVDVNVVECSSFKVYWGVVDRDQRDLLFRLVANNNLPNVLLVTQKVSTKDPGVPHDDEQRIDPSKDFPEELASVAAGGSSTGILSLFVSDAPAWEDPKPDNTVPGPKDLGLITVPDGGEDAFSVVEMRWAFQFNNGIGGCPQ